MALPEDFDWRKIAPGYEKGWSKMRPNDKKDAWNYILGEQERKEAAEQKGQEAVLNLLNQTTKQQAQPQIIIQQPAQEQAPAQKGLIGGGNNELGSLLQILTKSVGNR